MNQHRKRLLLVILAALMIGRHFSISVFNGATSLRDVLSACSTKRTAGLA